MYYVLNNRTIGNWGIKTLTIIEVVSVNLRTSFTGIVSVTLSIHNIVLNDNYVCFVIAMPFATTTYRVLLFAWTNGWSRSERVVVFLFLILQHKTCNTFWELMNYLNALWLFFFCFFFFTQHTLFLIAAIPQRDEQHLVLLLMIVVF